MFKLFFKLLKITCTCTSFLDTWQLQWLLNVSVLYQHTSWYCAYISDIMCIPLLIQLHLRAFNTCHKYSLHTHHSKYLLLNVDFHWSDTRVCCMCCKRCQKLHGPVCVKKGHVITISGRLYMQSFEKEVHLDCTEVLLYSWCGRFLVLE